MLIALNVIRMPPIKLLAVTIIIHQLRVLCILRRRLRDVSHAVDNALDLRIVQARRMLAPSVR